MSGKNPALPIKDHRFLIVGGASLVGSTTADEFLRRGAKEVVLLDNFSFGSKDAIKHLEGNPRVRVVQGDVMRLHELLKAFEGVDGVLHLAAMMTISMDRDPWAGLDVNIRGAQNVIEAARTNGVKKLVFASSNAVYGYGPGVAGDLVESTPFNSVGAPPAAILYGASKIVGEQLCRDAYRRYGLDYVVLRYSTVYGERQHYRAANALYIIETHDRIKAGERPRVIGDGSESKHFVYVGDVARANAAAFEAKATDVQVNVSGPAPTTTLELVQMVCEATGSDLKPEHVEPPAGKVRLTSGGAFKIDHTAAGKAIGWKPEVDMREGIRRLIEWRDETGA
ncbi:dTDP-glucose 4,6-dehydratase [Variibacter gotjawalensis]|uniref:dTDP-glucose 4,6-dehydratase n=1 Tax=Variibacter gotjawalensis TaxID=1333996 RepID=A0A0S3PWL0_9BRAD|nr:NAD-dependent epimerase/dehydratase family protein [Variibacter gotjawalensis]NIK46154.1 UDP-glucose 4-epimerase [Variibacter gotjawalensis]RZS48072.1 UDP-glucose 4-epimerase [Variibacter gotjawalensis]BAT60328.1 dTDP-glucose 4,6-dehydratase [Variibacter gotjawalensis]